MRRTDRLFDLIQLLRDGRLHRAKDLAETLEVSVRTIWRDMATLMASGLPIEGERGVGYMLSAPITLPPVALTREELEALRLGVVLVASTPVTGILDLRQAMAGFGSEPAIIVAAAFVISAGLAATGVTDRIGQSIGPSTVPAPSTVTA